MTASLVSPAGMQYPGTWGCLHTLFQNPGQGSEVCPHIPTQETPPAVLQLRLWKAFGMCFGVVAGPAVCGRWAKGQPPASPADTPGPQQCIPLLHLRERNSG